MRDIHPNTVIAVVLGLIAIAVIVFMRDQAQAIITPIIAALLMAWNPSGAAQCAPSSKPVPSAEPPRDAS